MRIAGRRRLLFLDHNNIVAVGNFVRIGVQMGCLLFWLLLENYG
jgi:hypothetical protein